MLPASNRGVGTNIGFPDVCLTPPTPSPVPYVNLGAHATAAPFAPTVFVGMMNALNLGSVIPLTTGDEAGTAHPTVMGAGTFTMGNPIVQIDGLPGINLLCPTTGNNVNDGLGAVVVPSVANVFYTLARDPAADAPSMTELVRSIARDLATKGVEASRVCLPRATVAVLRIEAMTRDLPARIYTLLQSAPAGIVLDLRGNPGGELAAALALASDFLPSGLELVTVTETDGDVTVHRSRAEGPHRVPLALLVDRRTASAAEVFAGCLQAHGRALVIGETTYGKGTAQALDGDRYGTVATLRLPNNTPLEGHGVRPDVHAPSARDGEPDAALTRAIDHVQRLVSSTPEVSHALR